MSSRVWQNLRIGVDDWGSMVGTEIRTEMVLNSVFFDRTKLGVDVVERWLADSASGHYFFQRGSDPYRDYGRVFFRKDEDRALFLLKFG